MVNDTAVEEICGPFGEECQYCTSTKDLNVCSHDSTAGRDLTDVFIWEINKRLTGSVTKNKS